MFKFEFDIAIDQLGLYVFPSDNFFSLRDPIPPQAQNIITKIHDKDFVGLLIGS